MATFHCICGHQVREDALMKRHWFEFYTLPMLDTIEVRLAKLIEAARSSGESLDFGLEFASARSGGPQILECPNCLRLTVVGGNGMRLRVYKLDEFEGRITSEGLASELRPPPKPEVSI